MNVKMTDVAKRLGISKAAVSLAVNNRPGVSDKTRRKVLDCIREMENGSLSDGSIPSGKILMIYFNHPHKHVLNANYPVYTEVLSAISSEASSRGFGFSTIYVEDTMEYAIAECNEEDVAGVIVFATHMTETEYRQIAEIPKPVVLYDQEAPDALRSSVLIDHRTALRMALKVLEVKNNDTVKYFGGDDIIYNITVRREYFLTEMMRLHHSVSEDDIIQVDFYSEPAAGEIEEWLRHNPLPDCIIAENYTVAIGLLIALRSLGIVFPGDVRVVSIDALPIYIPGQEKIWQVRLPHAERAVLLMDVLEKEIREPGRIKQRVLAIPSLVPPKSADSAQD